LQSRLAGDKSWQIAAGRMHPRNLSPLKAGLHFSDPETQPPPVETHGVGGYISSRLSLRMSPNSRASLSPWSSGSPLTGPTPPSARCAECRSYRNQIACIPSNRPRRALPRNREIAQPRLQPYSRNRTATRRERIAVVGPVSFASISRRAISRRRMPESLRRRTRPVVSRRAECLVERDAVLVEDVTAIGRLLRAYSATSLAYGVP